MPIFNLSMNVHPEGSFVLITVNDNKDGGVYRLSFENTTKILKIIKEDLNEKNFISGFEVHKTFEKDEE